MMIPNLIDSYGAVLRLGLPPLFGGIILYRFIASYHNARIHQDWLDRLRMHEREGKSREGVAPWQQR